jgi:NADPH2:quinone reductase
MELPTLMRAARYQTTGPEVGRLRLDMVERPSPAAGEVLVQMNVSGVNPTDWKARRRFVDTASNDQSNDGRLDAPGWVIPHHDGAGVVVEVGSGVPEHRVGERVWLWQAQWGRAAGTAAEFVSIPASQAVALPHGVDDDLAAGLGIPAMTAHYCLFIDGPLDGTDRVLVHGGAGAVGHAAIELARHAGARVATTVSSPHKAGIAEQAGADLVLDYHNDDVVGRLREWAPKGVTRIVEVDLAANLELDATLAAPGAAVLVYAQPTRPVITPWRLLEANVRLEFMLVYTLSQSAKRAAVAGVNSALSAGALTSLPIVRFPIADTARAHQAVEDNVVGKVLIDVAAR